MIESNNVFYVSNFNVIGGVETFIFELARKYHDYDITVVYKSGDEKQLKRLKKYIRVVKYDNQKIKCKKAFFNYETDIINNVEADEYIQLIHAMFKTQKLKPRLNSKITKYLCVSKKAGEEWEELTGFKCEHCRNPLSIFEEEKKETLYLISATRLTAEKGKTRIIKLAKELDKAKINYLWLVFTNDENAIDNPNIVYMKPRLDIRPFILSVKGKGYGVQLSDCEGDCYFTRECEALGVPLLVTPIPSFKEQGLVEEKNCYYIPFNVEEINNELINKIANNIPTYEPYLNEDIWFKQLAEGKSKYKEELKMKTKVKAIIKYYDIQLEKIIEKDTEFIVNSVRAEELVKSKVCEIIEKIEEAATEEKGVIEEVEEVEEVKPTEYAETIEEIEANKEIIEALNEEVEETPIEEEIETIEEIEANEEIKEIETVEPTKEKTSNKKSKKK